MPYIVYEKESTRSVFWRPGLGLKTFKSEGAAKAAITREIKKRVEKNKAYDNRGESDRWMNKPDPVFAREDVAIAEARDFYENIEKKVVRKNLIGGGEFIEGVNTPNYLSPASETYHSM